MRVLVYVEGPSDRASLEVLLGPIIAEGQQHRVGIQFLPLHGKAAVLDDSPRKAAAHLAEHPGDWVFALPDLYPMASYDKTANAHRSFAALQQLLQKRFLARAQKLGVVSDSLDHFRVYCLKHDLEGLLLAAHDQLRRRLKTTDALRGRWCLPVEDQNDDRPPKRIVEELFDKYRKKPGYIDTTDAPWILGQASLGTIEAGCPQCFAPFVAELRTLAAGQGG